METLEQSSGEREEKEKRTVKCREVIQKSHCIKLYIPDPGSLLEDHRKQKTSLRTKGEERNERNMQKRFTNNVIEIEEREQNKKLFHVILFENCNQMNFR